MSITHRVIPSDWQPFEVGGHLITEYWEIEGGVMVERDTNNDLWCNCKEFLDTNWKYRRSCAHTREIGAQLGAMNSRRKEEQVNSLGSVDDANERLEVPPTPPRRNTATNATRAIHQKVAKDSRPVILWGHNVIEHWVLEDRTLVALDDKDDLWCGCNEFLGTEGAVWRSCVHTQEIGAQLGAEREIEMGKKLKQAAFAFPSSGGSTTYEAIVYADGEVFCDCPGFRFKRRGQERTCAHYRFVNARVAALLCGTITREDVQSAIDNEFGIVVRPNIPTLPTPPSPPAPISTFDTGLRLIRFEEE